MNKRNLLIAIPALKGQIEGEYMIQFGCDKTH